jgi:simple sugar transport system substrate-binding protein
MVTHGQAADPFWALVRNGAKQAAADFNVALSYQSPKTTDPAAQATMIGQAAAKKPDAMVVTIPDAAVLDPPIRQATEGGMPVVAMNVGATEWRKVGALTFVGQDEQAAGSEAGVQMAAAGVRHALCVITEANNSALTTRCAGFAKQLQAAGGSAQVLQVDGTQLHAAQGAVERTLKNDPAITGVLSTTILGFSAVSGAVHEMNAFGRIKLASFDISQAALIAVQNGQALFVIDQQPFLEGYDAVQVAAFQVRFGQHPYSPIYTGPSLITKANAAKVAQLYKSTGVPLFKGGYPQ